MRFFGLLERWMHRGRRRQDSPRPTLPPRPEVLRQPEIDDSVVVRTRRATEKLHVSRPQRNAGSNGGEDRYRVQPSVEHGGPKWNPYAAEQSRAARVQSRRRARLRAEEQTVHDRFNPRARRTDGPTYYQLLGVEPNAPMKDIERAYRRYVASIHPDKFFDDPSARAQAEAQLREMNAIMQTLRDPVKRAMYDAGL